jgi:hypothetical protein
MVALTLAVTIAAALCLGVVLGYGAIVTILRALRRQPQSVPERTLAATPASSGD